MLLLGHYSVLSYAAEDNASFFDYFNEGYLVPSPSYPNKESLPYGEDTCVYDFYKYVSDSSAMGVLRIYVKRELYSGNGVSAFNGTSVVFVDNKTGSRPSFEILVTSSSPILYQWFEYDSKGSCYGFTDISKSSYTKSKNGMTYNFLVISGRISSEYSNDCYTGAFIGTDPAYYGGRDLYLLLEQNLLSTAPSDELPAHSSRYWISNIHKSYPTSNDLTSKNIMNSIDENTDNLVSVIEKESDSIVSVLYDESQAIQEVLYYNYYELVDINTALDENGEKLDTLNDTLDKTPNKIIEGIKGLFIPTEQEMIVIKDKWDLLLKERFGALYEAGSYIVDIANSFSYQGEKTDIEFPLTVINLKGSIFQFGGWKVKIIPTGFEAPVRTLKLIIGIVATLAFFVMLRNKFNKIIGDNT